MSFPICLTVCGTIFKGPSQSINRTLLETLKDILGLRKSQNQEALDSQSQRRLCKREWYCKVSIVRK